MCNIIRDRKDGVTVWLNNDPEPVGKDLEDKWDLVVKGPCDEVARHANMRRWDDPIDYKTVAEEDLNKVRGKHRAEVIIGTPRKPGILRNAGQLTLSQSLRVPPLSYDKEKSDTPSKKGTKRKADSQPHLFSKVATKASARKPKAQSKKATTASKNNELEEEAPTIDSVFKATKRGPKILLYGSSPARLVDENSASPLSSCGHKIACSPCYGVMRVQPG
jgi:NAD-dependent histone deacetylase SIR2